MQPETITEYIEQYDGDVRSRLEAVYELIRSAVPDGVTEDIRWRMPAFMLGAEPLFFFTGAKKHLSFYPTNEVITQYADELAGFTTTEHAVQFRHDAPLPIALLRDLIAWRLAQLALPPSDTPNG